MQKRPTRKEIEMIFLCLTLLKKVNRETVHRDFPLQKRVTREEIEIIFLSTSGTLLKKVNSTQRFFFARKEIK